MGVNRLIHQKLRNLLKKPESGAVEGNNLLTRPFPDFESGPVGSVIYRDAIGWNTLGPGTDGQVLSTQGAGADPKWIDPPTTAAPGAVEVTLTDVAPTYVRQINVAQPITLTEPNPTYTTAVNDP